MNLGKNSLDADLANNTMGWQWIAGSVPDAAPFFRILNPVLQGKWIHHPWNAKEEVLKDAGITLGEGYPRPIVDHKEACLEALAGYEKVKKIKGVI